MPEPLPHAEFARRRLVVMAAPNGARRGKADHPRLPMTSSELGAEARSLLEAGASVLHLHVRDARGCHTLDPDAYRAAIAAIRKAVGDDLVVQVTTEAVETYTPDQQMAMVRELRPEAVSLALRELYPEGTADSEAIAFFQWLSEAGVWPQYILYSPRELRRWDRLRRQGLFGSEAPFCLFVLGSYPGRRGGGAWDLQAYLETAECAEFPWAACCFGPGEHDAMCAVAAAGGHVRLGFENNLWLPDGSLADGNAELIQLFADGCRVGPRRAATAHEVRREFCRT